MKISLKKITINPKINKNFSVKHEKSLIREILLEFQAENSLANIIEKMSKNKELTYQYPNLFICKNYEIYVGTDSALKDTAEAYKIISKYNIDTYPEFIDSTLNNNQHFRILIIKKHKNKEESFIRYPEAKKNISIVNKKKFYDLHEKMANDTNLYNPSLIENIDNWYVDKDGIHISFCDELLEFENVKSKNEYLKDLKNILGLIY